MGKRKTHEQFIIDINKVNSNIQVIGKYIDVKTKVRVKCLIDGYEWNANPRDLLRGRKCAVCTNRKVVSGINDIATTRPDLVKYFKNKHESQKYTFGSDKIIDVVCPECGFEDKIRIGDLSRFGFTCNGCYEKKYGRQRVPYGYWNKDTMSKYLSENYPGYKLLDIDRVKDGSGTKCLKAFIKCPNESHDPYWAYWTNIISGCKCEQCYYDENNKIKWNPDLAYEYFKKLGYYMLNKNDFINTDISVACSDCNGFIYMITLSNLKKFKRGERSFFSMFQNNPYAIANVKQFCKLYRPDYQILSEEYNGSHANYKFYYSGQFDDKLDHIREFDTSIDSFIFAGTRHPSLTISRGERMAEEILNKHNIRYIPQKRYDDYRDVYTLPFDFYLPDYNLIIEIMGEQHEKPVALFGGQEGFEKRIEHDRIKREYLKNNNIPILDIWYYEFDNMEELILNKIQEILSTTQN